MQYQTETNPTLPGTHILQAHCHSCIPMQSHSPAFMPAQCCRHTVCKSLGPFFLGAQHKEHSGAGVALCPFGQGFSAVIWSFIFSLDVMAPSCLGCIRMPLPWLVPFHILAALPSWHYRDGCISALRTTWTIATDETVGGPVEELALHRPRGP